MSEAVVNRVKQRLIDGTLSKEQAQRVLQALPSMMKPQRTPEETERLRVQRLDEVPEIGSGSGLLAGQSTMGKAAVAGLLPVTTDPQEIAKVLESQFPGVIGVAQTPEGRLIARNNETGAVAELNKPGISALDVAQFLGVGSAFIPSGAGLAGTGIKTLGALAGRSAATQTGIEAAQAAGGGEFNPGQIAIEAAAAPGAQIVGEKLIKPALSGAARAVSNKFGRRAEDLAGEADALRQGFRSDAEVSAETVAPLARGREATVAESVDADPRILQAIQQEGITAAPTAAQVSRNSQFRDIEQALATIPGSRLDSQSREFIKSVSRRADDLIRESGGSVDKAAVSENFRQSSRDTIEALREQADTVYNKLDELIDPTTPAEASSTLAFIREKARELGGEDKLSGRMKLLLRDLSPKKTRDTKGFSYATGATIQRGEDVLPTHELLSQRRREVGQALGKKSGPFSDQEEGLLKALYARLSADQESVAQAVGGDAAAVSAGGKALVSQRKELEKNVVELLGKDLSKSITDVVGSSIKGLPKKGIAQFQKRINAIPEGNRQEIVATALNDIFRGTGANKQALDVTQFSKFMDDLNRSPAAKRALYSNLPPQARRSLTNLQRIAKGISEAQLQKTPTGRVLSLFDQKVGLIRKLVGRGAGAVAYTAGGGGLTGGAANNAVTELLTQSTSKAQAASDLLASDKFQQMIQTAVREGSIEGGQVSRNLAFSERALRNSEAFKAWANTLEDSALADALTSGQRSIAAYLVSENGDQQ